MNALKMRNPSASLFSQAQTVSCWQKWFGLWLAATVWMLTTSGVAFAQRDYEVVKPRERASNEKVIVRTLIKQPTEGVLAVVLDPIIPGKVVVENAAGSVIAEGEADETGQAEFTLPRGKAYTVKVSAPGFTSAESKSKPLQASEVLRLKLTARFATLKLRNLPAAAQILIDDQLRATVDQSGATTLADLAPGNHQLQVRHPEYNDYQSELTNLEAGDQITFLVPLERVAKLTVRGPQGAAVSIDGERRGEIQANGAVTINYKLAEASEHTILVEKLGFHDWTSRQLLSPGARTIEVKLEPIVTSAGVSDAFDDLSLWEKPSTWTIRADRTPSGKINGKLVVSGSELGILKEEKVYRDFDALFTIWLPDGKGASWAMRIDKTGRNYYLFYLAGPTSDTPRKFYTYLVRDGQMTQVSTPIPVLADLDQKNSFTISITVRGHKVEHKIISNATGEQNDLGIWTDTTETKNNFLYGTFGFRSLKGETFIVDDFAIEPSKEAEKATATNRH
jgi:hypothetical protein